MRMRMIFGGLVILALLAGSAMATTIPVKGDRSSLQLVNETRGELNFHVEVGSIEAMDVATKGGDFSRLLIPGFHTSKEEGQPELPMMNELVAIPYGATARVEVRNVETRLVNLADYGITNPVMPAQPSLSKSADLSKVPFIHDASAYNKSEVRRELASFEYQGTLRAMDFGRLEISPVTYLPRTGQLEIVESVDVSVTFTGIDRATESELAASRYSPFFDHLYASMPGAKAYHDDYPDRVGDQVTMVVVTPPMFASQLADFVAWKTERGFNTILAVTGTPEVGSTTASIQTYLHDLYNNATPENPAPSFVLFVGDVSQMPTFTLSGDATDRPYCAVDGDLVPDMYYGRFSATNPTELQAQLDKTMMYDQYTMPDPSYLSNVTLIAGVDGSYATTHGNGQINYGTEHYFNASQGITSNTFLYPGSSSGIEGDLIATYNAGVSFVNYTAHGSTTSWSNPGLSQSDINSLNNDGKYFLAVGNCCLTSSYDLGECFGETFLRAPEKGAIGYIGGSNSTYWDEDYWWGVGSHPSGEIDGSAYPYESTGIGAYDGVFHTHGEDAHLWYVTNDALIFSGNLACMEAGSSRVEYYWNIYNLLGDPSLSTYMGEPGDNNVVHPETVFVGLPSMTLSAEPGSYVGLTQDGVLMGSGTVDASGSLEVVYNDLLTPGVPMKMVVMAQKKAPYVVDLNVIVPATVTIDPMVIDVNVPTDITVTIYDADGINPLPGINVWAEGLGYETAPVMTDANGIAVVNVTSAYGPSINMAGQDPAESYRLFTEPVAVNAMDLAAPDLTVATDVGLVDGFALNLPGTMTATVAEAGHTLYAMLPGGGELSTPDYSMVVTPADLGMVTGIIAVSGYNVYCEDFEVVEAFGTVAGNVSNDTGALAGVTVTGYDMDSDVAFSVMTDAAGDWAFASELTVADYNIVIDHFGYLHYEQAIFVNVGANDYTSVLTHAPSGILTGTVVDDVTFEPLEGIVRVYRNDTGALYTEALCNVDGEFATGQLPYFEYSIKVRAYHHKPVTLVMTIEAPETVKNFALTATNGDLLLIDDNATDKISVAAKFGGKNNDVLLAEGYEADAAKSAAQMTEDLEELGYSVEVVALAEANPDNFDDYDIVVLACGNNTATLDSDPMNVKDGLVNFALAGGHILLEGGELGYDHYSSEPFASVVMHTNDWNHDSSGDLTPADVDAYIMNNPNNTCADMIVTYDGYGDSDAMAPLADAAMPMAWSEYPTDASVITYDPNAAPEGGQIVFFCFNYLSVDASRMALLENAVEWLLALEIGDASAAGTVLLAGQTDHSGVTITATPNGGTTVTAADGSWMLPGLYAGTYDVKAQKDGFGTQVEPITLEAGQNLTGVDFVMDVTYAVEECDDPGLAIPDSDENGVSTVITVDETGTISDLAVYLGITHTYQGDLIVTVTSPAGTEIVLHSRTGGTTEDIIGWYPEDIAPVDDMSVVAGEEMQGDWVLFVSDNAGSDLGTIDTWCLNITYSGPVATGVDGINGEVAANGMALTWEYQYGAVDGFNLYRRTEGTPEIRLNSELLTSTSGLIQFVDDGAGLEIGQTVYYSYAIVSQGREIGRGAEIQVQYASALPTRFALKDNYPNPFNPTTTIAFDMPRAGHARLDIYDVTGRLVKTLVNEVRAASAHTVQWSGDDNSGRRVASGTYYYKLTTDGYSATHKMMLVK